MSRTKAILHVLGRGREPKLAPSVLKVFGATTIEEALRTYDMVGAAERASLDQFVEHVVKDASAAFWLRVESKLAEER